MARNPTPPAQSNSVPYVPPAGKPWYEPPFSDEELDHHQAWLDAHGQDRLDTDACPVCIALAERSSR